MRRTNQDKTRNVDVRKILQFMAKYEDTDKIGLNTYKDGRRTSAEAGYLV